MDGVLLDVSRSIRQVNCLAIPTFLRTLPGWSAPDDLVSSNDIERFKEAGGFNDDWDLSCAAILLYLFKAQQHGTQNAVALNDVPPTLAQYTNAVAARGGWLAAAEAIVFEQTTPSEEAMIRAQWDKALIHRIFQELWAGDLCARLYGYAPTINPGPGWVRLDRPLLDVARLPPDKTLAVLTGRTLAEAQLGLERCGLEEIIALPARGVTQTDGFYKPDPRGMALLLARLNAKMAIYIGDSRDDLRTVLNFRERPEAAQITLLSAQVLTGTTHPADAPALFADADILAPDVHTVLDLLRFEGNGGNA